MSVFTHITVQWSQWLTELHRVIRPGGLAVLSVLGPAMAQQILGSEWDQRIGIAWVDLHKNWDVGGPDVLLSEWWIREHWGRAFEIVRYLHADPADGPGHDLVAMRRRETSVTPERLAAVDPADVREHAAIVCNLELLWRQQRALGDELRSAQENRMAADRRARELEAKLQAMRAQRSLEDENAQLRAQLLAVTQSKSWRMTAILRRSMAAIRKRRS